MNLFVCEHPLRVYNKYTRTYETVPCGKCNVCRNRRSASWVDRLEIERKAHKYCVFFTLTYSEEFVPKVVLSDNGSSLVNPDTGEIYTFSQLHLYDDDMKDSLYYVRIRRWMCVMDTFYIQHFIKRLRSRVCYAEKGNSIIEKTIRYYVNSEYGPTTHRLHHHGLLFFESEWLARNAKEIIASCWSTDNRTKSEPIGRTDVQIVDTSSATPSYVARYVNCFSHLPKIYQYKPFLPKSIFSKHPPLGSLFYGSKDLEDIFNSEVVRIGYPSKEQQSLVYKPLPQSFKDRLYPKIKGYRDFSHNDLVKLYGLLSKEDCFVYDYKSFCRYLESYISDSCTYIYQNNKLSAVAKTYQDECVKLYIQNILMKETSCKRYFTVLRRFEYNRYLFKLSVDDYVSRIERFYLDCDRQNLKEQYEFESDFTKTSSSKYLLWLDWDYVRMLKELPDLDKNQRLQFLSFGFDDYQFVNRSDLVPGDCPEYARIKSLSYELMNNTSKVRVKNEYLAHRDINKLNFIYGKT